MGLTEDVRYDTSTNISADITNKSIKICQWIIYHLWILTSYPASGKCSLLYYFVCCLSLTYAVLKITFWLVWIPNVLTIFGIFTGIDSLNAIVTLRCNHPLVYSCGILLYIYTYIEIHKKTRIVTSYFLSQWPCIRVDCHNLCHPRPMMHFVLSSSVTLWL